MHARNNSSDSLDHTGDSTVHHNPIVYDTADSGDQHQDQDQQQQQQKQNHQALGVAESFASTTIEAASLSTNTESSSSSISDRSSNRSSNDFGHMEEHTDSENEALHAKEHFTEDSIAVHDAESADAESAEVRRALLVPGRMIFWVRGDCICNCEVLCSGSVMSCLGYRRIANLYSTVHVGDM